MLGVTLAPKVNEARTARNLLTSPLLRLPAELRNKIYEYVTFDGYYRHQVIPSRNGAYTNEARRTTIGPPPTWKGLVSTCRQLHAEAASLPYALNTIAMAGRGTFHEILAQLAALGSPVSTLRVELNTHKEVWERKPATKFPSLKKVEVVLRIDNRDRRHPEFYNLSDAEDSDDEDKLDSLQADMLKWLEDIIDGHIEVAFLMRYAGGDEM